MKTYKPFVILALGLVVTGCATQANQPNRPLNTQAQSTNVETENKDKEAQSKATSYTMGWPDSATSAAKEMISKYGDPTETTSESLIWRNVAPFKRITVYKEVYSHRFPLLHQTPVEHVVSYRVPSAEKVSSIWKFSGAITLDRVRGEMSAIGLNEPMNVLSLNMANDIITGKRTPDAARIRFGQESLDYLNGFRSDTTQTLSFGSKLNTADAGQTVTDKIRWVGKEKRAPAAPRTQNINLRQAQEE